MVGVGNVLFLFPSQLLTFRVYVPYLNDQQGLFYYLLLCTFHSLLIMYFY